MRFLFVRRRRRLRSLIQCFICVCLCVMSESLVNGSIGICRKQNGLFLSLPSVKISIQQFGFFFLGISLSLCCYSSCSIARPQWPLLSLFVIDVVVVVVDALLLLLLPVVTSLSYECDESRGCVATFAAPLFRSRSPF